MKKIKKSVKRLSKSADKPVKESIRSILRICDKSRVGLAQFQIVDLLSNYSPQTVVSALKKMSKSGKIINSNKWLRGTSGIIRLYYLPESLRYSAKDYTGGFSLSMA